MSDRIKAGLSHCASNKDCKECPYFDLFSQLCFKRIATHALAYIQQLEAELEQVKAERDRYWQYIESLGCDTCGGDCDRCEVGLDRVWSGWVWDGEKETKHG